MKCASDTWAMRASPRTSSGWAYVRSIASRARSIRRLESSTARLTAHLRLLTRPTHRPTVGRVRGHLHHSASRPRTDAPGSARSPAAGPAAVLALQRSVGNRAVRQVLQRAPTGLKESKPTTDFTNDALAY